MITKIVINIILIISLAVAQISFISGLPGQADNLNLVLVVLIFILGFSDFDFAIWWSLGAGVALEIFSFLPFGIYLVSLTLAAISGYLLLNYFFTSRSLYSFLALTGLATVIYEIIFGLAAFISAQAGLYAAPAENNFGISAFWQVSLNMLAAFFIFYLVHFFGRNLRPVFLNRPVKPR